MNITFTSRSLNSPLLFPGVFFRVERLTWNLSGGPEQAEVSAYGPPARLWALLQVLRCGATITGDDGAPAWWGYVHEVSVSPQAGGAEVFAALDDLYNAVAVRYHDERPAESVTYGWQFQTAWQSDAASTAEWGARQGVWTVQNALDSEAQARAATLLQRYKVPALRARASARPARAACARLRLRGWWDTLGWTAYSEPRGYSAYLRGSAQVAWGASAAQAWYAESLHASGSGSWSAGAVWFRVGKYGQPADTLTAFLYANAGGLPGAVLASSSVSGASIDGDALTWKKFTFGAPYTVSGGTSYFVCLARSGAMDANNCYILTADKGLGYAGEAAKMWNGSTWVTPSPGMNLSFALTGQSQTSDQILQMAGAGAGGQFLRGAFVQDASGVQGRLYRDGSRSALEEIRALLDLGTSAGERLMAQVTAERWLLVKRVPPQGSVELQVRASGELRAAAGGRLAGGQGLVGRWARVEGMEQTAGPAGASGAVLVTRAEWSEAGGLRALWEDQSSSR